MGDAGGVSDYLKLNPVLTDRKRKVRGGETN